MYTAVSVCGPARSAILTGRRPDATHAWSLSGKEGYWRNYLPNAYSLPQYFRMNGYETRGIGKIFHPGAISGDNDKAHSWSPGKH
jgi:iduronate 2-sulfatase